MVYSDLELLRKKLADPFRQGQDEIIVDLPNDRYLLAHDHLKANTLTVAIDNTTTTAYTKDEEEGLIVFTSPPTKGQRIIAQYEYSTFSDIELQNFLDTELSIEGVMVECLEILINDSARRSDYVAGQFNVKASQVFANLKSLLEYYQGKISVRSSSVRMISREANRLPSDRNYIGEEDTYTFIDISRDDF